MSNHPTCRVSPNLCDRDNPRSSRVGPTLRAATSHASTIQPIATSQAPALLPGPVPPDDSYRALAQPPLPVLANPTSHNPAPTPPCRPTISHLDARWTRPHRHPISTLACALSRPSNGSIRDAARKRAQLRGGGMTPVTSSSRNVPAAKPREPRLPVLRAKDGETVAVTIIDREETRIGQYFDEGDFIRLQPLNPFLDPIYEPRMNVRIEARVVAVIRTF